MSDAKRSAEPGRRQADAGGAPAADAAPRRKRRDSRIAEILAAARILLESRGLSEFTIADVAKATGVSEATVFGYFGSRRELMYQVISAWMAPVMDRLDTDLPTIDGSAARIRFFVLRHLLELEGAPGLHRLIYRELHWDDYYGSQLHRLNQRYTGLVRWIVEDGKRIGDIDPSIDTDIARDQIFGTLHHFGWRTLMNGRSIDIAQTAQQIAMQLFKGIRTQAAPVSGDGFESVLARLQAAVARLEADGDRQSP